MSIKKFVDRSVLRTDAGVVLVASGYSWRCPECEDVSYVSDAVNENVTCEHCQGEFTVAEVQHRSNDRMLSPGVMPAAVYVPTGAQYADDDERKKEMEKGEKRFKKHSEGKDNDDRD